LHLRKLEMRGFKTFADKTEVVFHPGVSAIVGPNGVGKSNVTDAILWALGEQSAKTLRTENLQDVIFVGSEKRRQLNMAEVSLTLDNADGTLQSEYSEVVISRRVFRDGNAEYLINNSVCRLKDVRELLLDTGVGPKAYSVVGQGEIDAILSIRGEDRRELLEEVAGVRKYRVRRQEAERKLDATQVNLTRVADIVHELSSQREPLERQAERARAYKDIDEKLQKLELYLLGADYRRHNDKRGQLANEVAVARADLQVTRNMINEVDAEYQKLAAMVLKLEGELEKVRLEALHLQREAAAEREKRAVNQERQRSLSSRKVVLDETLVEHRQRQQSLAEQSQALALELKALRDRLNTEEQQLKSQIADYEAKRVAADRHRQKAAQLDEQRVKTLQEIARLENEAAALASLQADLQERISRLDSQREQLDSRLQTIEGQVEDGEEKSAQLRQAVEDATRKQVRAEKDIKYIQSVIRDHSVKRGLLSDAVSRLESRQKVLDELRNSYEGYSEGTRNVMSAVTAGKLPGVRGVLGEALEVPQKLEVAIEAALDEKLQWILVNTQDDALRAIDYLRAEGLGRAAFFPLSSGSRQQTEPINLSGLRGGVLGVASKLVKVNKEFGAAVEGLLSRIIICSDVPSALEAYQRFTGRYTVVTLTGEVLQAEGVVRGGALEGGAGQGFSRLRELEALQGQIVVLKDSQTRMLRVEEALEAELSRARASVEETAEKVNALRSDVRQSEGDLKYLQDQRKAALEAREETRVEIGKLRERLGRDTERQQGTEDRCATLRTRLEELQAEIEQTRAQAGTGAEREALRQALTQREVSVAELREKVTASNAVCNRAAEDLRHATNSRQAAENELSHISGELVKLESELASGDGAEDDLQRAAALEAEAENKAEVLARLREKTAQCDAKRRELMKAQEGQSERLHVADLSLARSEANLQGIAERLGDLFQMSIEQALEITLEGMTENQARREAGQLRSEMRNLGQVNLGSIEECERLKAREDFLRNQQDDLLKAKDDLLEVIRELDEAAQVAFMETFEKVAIEFDEIFKRLFQGGTTQLCLTNPDDPLNSGVDVIVTPPGKRQQNLLLLSGGERAMTALALLFALLRVKPSPFCVMDEIDAALDAANTDRFAEMVREFSDRSQFIIITHNPRTMEKTDVLHGITMQEPGVSKLISVELEQAKKVVEQQGVVEEVE
jgi:chromosome segregation protein